MIRKARKGKIETPEEKEDDVFMFKRRSPVKQYNDIGRQRDLEIMREQKESLDNVRIEKKTIEGMDFRTVKFQGVVFEDTIFNRCIFQGCDFSGMDRMKDAVFLNCDMRWATFKTAHIHENDFNECNMSEINKVI